jgi:hypothetical protein
VSDLCNTGGLLNANGAVEAAEKLNNNLVKKLDDTTLPKSSFKNKKVN